jgi:hypothetical protein
VADQSRRPFRAKVQFVVLAGDVYAACWLLERIVRDHRTAHLGSESFVPGDDGWSLVASFVELAFLVLAPGIYRRLFAGPHWAREVFIAMTAVYAESLLLVAIVSRTWSHSWHQLALDPPTVAAAVFSGVICVMLGGVSVGAAGVWGPERLVGVADRKSTPKGDSTK